MGQLGTGENRPNERGNTGQLILTTCDQGECDCAAEKQKKKDRKKNKNNNESAEVKPKEEIIQSEVEKLVSSLPSRYSGGRIPRTRGSSSHFRRPLTRTKKETSISSSSSSSSSYSAPGWLENEKIGLFEYLTCTFKFQFDLVFVALRRRTTITNTESSPLRQRPPRMKKWS